MINIAGILGAVLPKIFGVVDKAVLNKDDAAKLKGDIQLALIEADGKELQAATAIIVAEVQGKSWLQRNWRPLLMISIIAIIVNNYIIYPYVILFGGNAVILDLPPELYNMMAIGVGGYVVGRSGEKIVTNWKNGSGS